MWVICSLDGIIWGGGNLVKTKWFKKLLSYLFCLCVCFIKETSWKMPGLWFLTSGVEKLQNELESYHLVIENTLCLFK